MCTYQERHGSRTLVKSCRWRGVPRCGFDRENGEHGRVATGNLGPVTCREVPAGAVPDGLKGFYFRVPSDGVFVIFRS
jgi:hypothetical protein